MTYMEPLREYLEKSQKAVSEKEETLLEMLFDIYTECNGFDNDMIRRDFNALYRAMNGKSLREIDAVIYPVCTLCRDHEKAGFTEGVRVGVRLLNELR